MDKYETNLMNSLDEMIDGYHKANIIERLQEAIEVTEIFSNRETSSEFFRIGTRSKIPYRYLREEVPITGIDMVGRKIAHGETKTVADRIIESITAIDVSLETTKFSEIIEDTYSKIHSIRAVFMPIKFFSQLYKEGIIKFENGNEYIVIRSDKISDKIRLVLSNNFSDWGDKIIFLGDRSIDWIRKKNPPLPPKIGSSYFKKYSKEDEYLKVGYKMHSKEAEFIIYTVSKCRVANFSNIVIYSPEIKQEPENEKYCFSKK